MKDALLRARWTCASGHLSLLALYYFATNIVSLQAAFRRGVRRVIRARRCETCNNS